MSILKITGPTKLKGEIEVYGMKNAALPCIAATLLTSQTCTLKNVPKITDVMNLLLILQSLGASVVWTDESVVEITCANVDPKTIDRKLVKSMRSSVLILAPMLVRFGEVTLAEPGGCIIGNRPLDAHISVLKGLGCNVSRHQDGLRVETTKLIGGTLFARFSVTATENALMAATGAEGTTVIRLAAREPHVVNLAEMLAGMGARIEGEGSDVMIVEGGATLHGVTHTIIPDQIEIGTFVAAAAATRGQLSIGPVIPEHLDSLCMVMNDLRLPYEFKDDRLIVTSSGNLESFKLQSLPYPGFPTDLQAPFGVVATQCAGTSLIHDPMYEGRMGYVNELIKMGANAVICDPHRVLISGPTPLYGSEIRSLDLRAGATLLIAGILAEGETIINDAQILDRGYYRLQERLSACGAQIESV